MVGGYSAGYGDGGFHKLQVVTVAHALSKRANVTWVSAASPDIDPHIHPQKAVADIPAALIAASTADHVVLVIGDSGCAHNHLCTCGENADRVSLGAAGGQEALLNSLTISSSPHPHSHPPHTHLQVGRKHC
jgi:hypothetical protein